ncbi:HAD family hydrolase [Mesorhizobium sp. Cs1299R1N1]|uniref:HAD family hydrolase n=1 Tax=Mesorhizobium sp. Cs1299R1N1 TaxID=3015172 RepID=UPI00301DFEFA
MSIELVICDCDGVLVDSEIIACRVDAEELGQRGFPDYTLEIVLRRFAGMSQHDMIASIEKETGLTIGGDFARAVERRVQEAISTDLQALPGAAEVIGSLALRKCVASSSRPDKLDLALSVTGLRKYFDPYIFSSVLVDRGKPAPDLFFYAAAQMGVPPQRACVIEDSIAGVTAAIAAGMPVVGFVGGSHCSSQHADSLLALGAAAIVSHWSEIPDVIGRLN